MSSCVPDADGRERLLRLYGGGSGVAELDLADAIARTEGLTATYLRELVRRAVLAAALARPGDTPVVVQHNDLGQALTQLQDSRSRLTRALLGDGSPRQDAPELGVTGWSTYGPSGAGISAAAAVLPGWQDDERGDGRLTESSEPPSTSGSG